MRQNKNTQRILAADVGGTSSRFANFILEDGELRLEHTLKLSTVDAPDFISIVREVRAQWPEPFDAAALAAAGPVISKQRRVRLSNVKWPIDLDDDALVKGDLLPKDTRLLNDFSAQGWACLCPAHQDLLELTPDIPAVTEPVSIKAVFGGGTGLGLCALQSDGAGPRVMPSEGGHAPFPLTPDEADYGRFVQARGARADGDHLLSGRGLTYLHAFHTGEELTPPEVAAKAHPAVVEWYARFCGRMAQSWTLYCLGLGGVYVTGGIAAANPMLVQHPAFREAFYDCPQFMDTLQNIPLYLVRNTDVALWGSALFAAFGERA